VQASIRKGTAEIERVLSVDIPADVDVVDPASLGGFLRELLHQQKIRTDRVLLDVPRDQVLLSTLILPKAPPDELPAVVEFQITKELPFSASEAVVDFAVHPAAGADRLEALVATVRREVLDQYRRTCEAAGVKPERIGLRPRANNIAVNELLGDRRPERVVMVDVGPNLMEINVIKSGQLVFSRAASVAVPRDLTGKREEEAEDASPADSTTGDEDGPVIRFPSEAGAPPGFELSRVIETLLVEVTRSVEAYRTSDPGATIDMVVVGGSVGLEEQLGEVIKSRFDTVVEFYNPARCFGWPEDRGRQALAFAAPLGLVLGHAGDRLHFDFLHPKKPVTEAQRRRRKVPVAALAAALFIAAGVVFYARGIAPQKKELAGVRNQIRRMENAKEKLEEFEETIQAAQEFESGQIIWIDELDRVVRLLPPAKEMVLKNIDMNQKSARMSFKLECTHEKVINDTVDKLDAFQAQGEKKPYYEATALATTHTKGQYPVSSSIEIVVLDKVKE
jgi:type IV pilus assembly protein PilM